MESPTVVALFCAAACAESPGAVALFCAIEHNVRGASAPLLLSLRERRGEGASESRTVRLSRTLTLTLSRRERGPDERGPDGSPVDVARDASMSSISRRRCAFGAPPAQHLMPGHVCSLGRIPRMRAAAPRERCISGAAPQRTTGDSWMDSR